MKDSQETVVTDGQGMIKVKTRAWLWSWKNGEGRKMFAYTEDRCEPQGQGYTSKKAALEVFSEHWVGVGI